MANLKPTQTKEFLAQQKPRYGDRPLGQPKAVRYPADVDDLLNDCDWKTYIRAAVREKMERDGLLSPSATEK
jgi:hypothetical protein